MGQVVLDPDDPVRRDRARAPAGRPAQASTSNLTRGAWSLIDQLAVSGGGFIGVVAMARNLPPEDYGVFSLLFGAMLALQLANATLIFHPLSVRLPVALNGRRRRLISDSAILAVTLAAILCAPLAIGLWAMGYGELVAPSVACFLAWQAQEAMRRGFFCSFRIPEAIPGDVLRYGGQGAGIIALAWFGELTLARALWIIAAAASLAVLLQGWQLKVSLTRLPRLKATAIDFWSIGGVWTLGAGLLSHFRTHLLPIALALFHGPVAAAGFQAALNVINLLNPVTISLGNIIPQAVAEGHKKSVAAAWGAARGYLLLGLAPIIGYGLLTLAVPTFVLSIFYGSDSPYVALTAPLQLLMGGIMLAYAAEVFDSFLHGIVEVRTAFYIMALGTLVVAVTTFPLVYAFGLVGGCISFILANLARLIASVIVHRQIMSRRPAQSQATDIPGSAPNHEASPMIISVVTPTLNALEYLPRCVDSIRAAATPGVEIEHVIVDGGSTDGTVEYAREQGLTVLTGKDKGIFDAINKGTFASKGDLVGFLGADDVMMPDGMRAIADAYRKTDRRWIVGGIRWIDENDNHLGDLAALPEWMTPRMISSLGWNPVMHMATYISRDFFEELEGFNIEFKDSGDYELFMRAMAREPYARVSTRISAFRRTGHNNSVVQAERMKWQKDHVLGVHGPKSALEQTFWRYFVKVWLNVANPGWFYIKMKQALRSKLGLASGGHFAKAAG